MGEDQPAELGSRLRDERTRQGLSVRELARRLHVSPSLVSQIETGKAQPSVKTLYAIVSELGVSLDEIFTAKAKAERTAAVAAADRSAIRSLPSFPEGEAPASSSLLRREARQAIALESGVRWERLTTSQDPDVDFIYAVYAVGGSSSPSGTLVRHSGREFGLVLEGRLSVTVGFEEFTLGPGDSISFESTTPHRLHNDGDEEVHAVWVVLGRRQGPVPS